MSVDVIPLQRSQASDAGLVLARAFQDDPLYSYILSDPDERAQRLPDMFTALVKYTVIYGLCDTTPGLDGAACWLAPGKADLTFWRVLRAGMGLQLSVARFSPAARKRFLEVMAYADEARERLMGNDYWYLWALGVAPESQGKGIGGGLIQPMLDRADAEGFRCYLETQTEPNAAFYGRRGFRILEAGPVPGHGVPFWTMVRDPVV